MSRPAQTPSARARSIGSRHNPDRSSSRSSCRADRRIAPASSSTGSCELESEPSSAAHRGRDHRPSGRDAASSRRAERRTPLCRSVAVRRYCNPDKRSLTFQVPESSIASQVLSTADGHRDPNWGRPADTLELKSRCCLPTKSNERKLVGVWC